MATWAMVTCMAMLGATTEPPLEMSEAALRTPVWTLRQDTHDDDNQPYTFLSDDEGTAPAVRWRFGASYHYLESKLDAVEIDQVDPDGNSLDQRQEERVDRDVSGFRLFGGVEKLSLYVGISSGEFFRVYDTDGFEVGLMGLWHLRVLDLHPAVVPFVEYRLGASYQEGQGDVPLFDIDTGIPLGTTAEEDVEYWDFEARLGVGAEIVDHWLTGLRVSAGLAGSFLRGEFERSQGPGSGDVDGDNFGVYGRLEYQLHEFVDNPETKQRDLIPVFFSAEGIIGQIDAIVLQLGIRF